MDDPPLNNNLVDISPSRHSHDDSKHRYELKIAHHSLIFSSAHFLINHAKCGRLHGHNYSVSVLIEGPITEQDMVIDFMKIKKLIREVCAKLDHKILVPHHSPFLEILITEKSIKLKSHRKLYIFPKEDCVILEIEAVTSELLASYIWKQLASKLVQKQFSVLIEETPGAVAKFGVL